MKDPNGYNVRAVERALQILECFDDENPERGVSEIAQVVGLHKATTHRIITTLLNFGYMERSPDGQKYRLGIRLTELGLKVVRQMDLRREAEPYMRQFVTEWDETCDLSIFDRGEVFYIEVLRGSRALTIAAAIGQRLPAYCTASGKLFLAYLSPTTLESILGQKMTAFTVNTITSPEAIRNQLGTTRQVGYAIDDEELEVGIYAISAPIFNRQGNVIAAVGSPCPVSRMTPDRTQGLTKAIKQAAQAISRRMGWQG